MFLADVTMRMVRNPVAGASPALVFEGSMEFLPFSEFEPAPVRKGSLVLIDGKVKKLSMVCVPKQTGRQNYFVG